MGACYSDNQMDLVETAQRLGRKTIALGLIPGFTVQHCAEATLFSVVDYPKLLTPEEAYLCFQMLIEEFDAIPTWLVDESPFKLVEWAIADFASHPLKQFSSGGRVGTRSADEVHL